MNKNKFSTKYLVEMALLVAIILLMAFTPIGYIKTAGLEITLIVVPVAVGAVTLGPTAGADLRRGIWNNKLYPVLRNEPVWCIAAWNQPIPDIPCMCSDTYSDGMAYRTYLSWITKNKDSVSSIRYDCQPLLPIIEYNILYGNACDIICIHHA